MFSCSIARAVALVSLVLPVAACTAPSSEGAPETDEAPLNGHNDTADRSCKVVLRTAAFPDLAASTPPAGAAWYPMTVIVDVASSLVSAGAKPGVSWRGSFGKTAFQSEQTAKPIAGAPHGKQRFEIEIAFDTFPTELAGDATALAGFQMSLVPFVKMPNGARLFDHNRIKGNYANYTLWSGDTQGGVVPAPSSPEIGKGFAIADDTSLCR